MLRRSEFERHVAHVEPSIGCGPMRVAQALQQGERGGLAGAGRADQRDGLAGGGLEAGVEHALVAVRGSGR